MRSIDDIINTAAIERQMKEAANINNPTLTEAMEAFGKLFPRPTQNIQTFKDIGESI